MDTMSFTMLIRPELAELAVLNAPPVPSLPLPALLAIPPRTELLVLMLLGVKLVSVKADTILLLMDHVSNQTAMLILSALSASRVSSCVFSAWLQRTESSSFPKASVSARTDTMLTAGTTVSLVHQDAEFAHLPPTAPAASLLPHHPPMDNATVPPKPTSPSLPMELDIVLLAVPSAQLVLMLIPAPPV